MHQGKLLEVEPPLLRSLMNFGFLVGLDDTLNTDFRIPNELRFILFGDIPFFPQSRTQDSVMISPTGVLFIV